MEKKVLAFLLSALFLYLAGVLTGVYLGSTTALDITAPLKAKTETLEKKMEELEEALNASFYTLFILQLLPDKNTACSLVEQSLDPVFAELGQILEELPPRLEKASISTSLENRYTTLNVRAFLADYYLYRNCGGRSLPVLYIYEHGDIESGHKMDRLQRMYNIKVYVAWRGADNAFIRALDPKGPSVYVCGRLVGIEEAEEVIRSCLGFYS